MRREGGQMLTLADRGGRQGFTNADIELADLPFTAYRSLPIARDRLGDYGSHKGMHGMVQTDRKTDTHRHTHTWTLQFI